MTSTSHTLIVALLLCPIACDDDAATSTTDTAADATASGDLPPAAPSTVRVAHFAPDAPPVDFCFLPTEGPAIGPVLGGAGLAGGIAFGDVTPYLPVDNRVYTVRVIGGGAPDCTQPVADYPNIAVPAGGLAITAAAVGYFDANKMPGLQLVFFIDDASPPTDGKAKLRILHAAPGTGSVDLGLLAAGATTLTDADTLVRDALYTVAPVPPFTQIEARGNVTLRAQLVSDPRVGVEQRAVDLSAGTSTTVFLIGEPTALTLLVCQEGGDGACSTRSSPQPR